MSRSSKDYWHRNIIAEQAIDATCLISKIANYLYPEITMAADRDKALQKEFPDFVAKIEPILAQRRIEAHDLLKTYPSLTDFARAEQTP